MDIPRVARQAAKKAGRPKNGISTSHGYGWSEFRRQSKQRAENAICLKAMELAADSLTQLALRRIPTGALNTGRAYSGSFPHLL